MSPWKNGGGITHEAIRVPAVGDPFQWRVSVAEIDRSGPFSDFAGYQRNMVLLRGNGMRLTFHGGAVTELRATGDLIEFDGATATQCDLTDGPCVDLNLMVRNGVEAEVGVHRVQEPLTLTVGPGAALLIFPIDGRISASGGACDSSELAAWDLAIASRGAYRLAPPVNYSAPTAVFLATIGP